MCKRDDNWNVKFSELEALVSLMHRFPGHCDHVLLIVRWDGASGNFAKAGDMLV